MGIDIDRFTGAPELYEQFKCPICLDVVEVPITTVPCDHIFCKSCFRPGRCPICRGQVTRTMTINRVSNGIYQSLTLKCSFDGCDQELTVGNYKSHEANPHSKCSTCGFNPYGRVVYRNATLDPSRLVIKIETLKAENNALKAEVAKFRGHGLVPGHVDVRNVVPQPRPIASAIPVAGHGKKPSEQDHFYCVECGSYSRPEVELVDSVSVHWIDTCKFLLPDSDPQP